MSSFKKRRRKMMRPFEAIPVYAILYTVKIFTFRGARRIGKFLGLLIYCVPSQRKLALANLDIAFPEKSAKEKKKIARTSLQGIATVFIEFMWFYKRPDLIEKYVKIPEDVRKEYFKYKDPEKPLIMLAMHWGNWELSTRAFKLMDDVEGSVIARRLKNPYLENLMIQGREGKGLTVIHEKGAARGIVKALRNKLGIGMLVDQNTKTHQGGVFGKFFDLPVTIAKTPASLARKMNTMLMLVNCKRTKDGFELCMKHLPKKVEEYKDDNELSEAVLQRMEEFVRDAPEQWVWLYKRWNYVPMNWADKKDKYPYYAIMDKKLEYPS